MPIFPPSGGGSAFAGFKSQYVSPTGSNSNPGTQFAPRKTASKAYSLLAPGGSLYLANGVDWSDGTEGLGLTAGQGCWLSGNPGTLPDGWLALKPINLYGYGLQANSQLGMNYVDLHWGSSGVADRKNPGFWIHTSGVPVHCQDMRIIGQQPWRIGWDYRRNADATIAWGNITSATRTSGVTTFTVDFPAPYTVTRAGRSGGQVSIECLIARPSSNPFDGADPKDWVVITSSDGNFASGHWQLDNVPSGVDATHIIFQYTDGGADVPFAAPAGAMTMGGHGCQSFNGEVGDIIEVESTDSNWQSTMYMVTAVTFDTLTVADPYGADHGPTANIGQYVLQDRGGNCGVSFDQLVNCSGYQVGGIGTYKANQGPSLDRGDQSAGQWSWVYDGDWFGGHYNAGGDVDGCKDPNLGAAHFVCAGAHGNIGFFQEKSRFHLGALRLYGGLQAPWFVTARDMMHQWDVNMGTIPATPCYQVAFRGSRSYQDLVNLSCADGSPNPAGVDLGGSYGDITINNCETANPIGYLVEGPSFPWVTGGAGQHGTWGSITDSYEKTGLAGLYANDGRLAGKRDDLPGSFGVIQYPGFSNKANTDLSAYTTSGTITISANQSTLGLDKSDKAFKLDCTAGGTATTFKDITTSAAAAGDIYVFGCWMRSVSGKLNNGGGTIVSLVYQGGGTTVMDIQVPFGGDGEWQWVTNKVVLPTGNVGKTTLRLIFDSVQSHPYFVYMPTVLHLDAATYSANEAARIWKSFRPIPGNLGNGMAGTMPGIKLIGYDGIGTDAANAKTVGAGSGQLTLTGTGTVYLPTYDKDGTTIIGWVAQLQATVNP